MAPTAAQAKSVQQQWDGCDKDAFILQMFAEMFSTHPEWRQKFPHAGEYTEPTWKKQRDQTRDALAKAVQMCVGDQEGLKAVLHEMAKRHVGYKVGQPEFQAVKPLLLTVAEKKVAGADKDAWMAVLAFICDNLVV